MRISNALNKMFMIVFILFFTSFLCAQERKIDVWDFGGVEEKGSQFRNNITRPFLDSFIGVTAGKFNGGETSWGDLTLNAFANDRLYYYTESGMQGKNSYGSQGYASFVFDDGYSANGIYYCNGTGGEGRRFFRIENIEAGDTITVYSRNSNAVAETLNFVSISKDGAKDGKHSEIATIDAVSRKFSFIASFKGTYKIYTDATAGKPVYYRLVRTPGVKVSGTISLSGKGSLDAGYSLAFINRTNSKETIAITDSKGNYSTSLSPGFEYTAILKNAGDLGIEDSTKIISVTKSDAILGTKEKVMLTAVVKKTYGVSGSLIGIEGVSNFSTVSMLFTPPANTLYQPVTATLDGAKFVYSGILEPDVTYTVYFIGLNDFYIKSGATFVGSKSIKQNITFDKKPLYPVSGSFTNKIEGTVVSNIVFTNIDDSMKYEGIVEGESYSAQLREGSYKISIIASGQTTLSHVRVQKDAVSKDVRVVAINPVQKNINLARDIYVGYPEKKNNYTTIREAVQIAAAMNPQSEKDRITIHIAPGTYREQVLIATPYLSLVNDKPTEEVKMTWYYGIGYKYYSAGKDGFYSEDYAADSFGKNSVAKWGAATYIQSSAKYFRASGITFETSFSKYMTDEELADGVEGDGTIPFVRKLSSDVSSRSAIERASALAVEGDFSEFYQCRIIGSQDTLFTGTLTHLYFRECYIEGNTDYIFGDGDVVFDSCELQWCGYSDTASGGYIAVTKDTAQKGYFFKDCVISEKEGKKHAPGYFGRPWGAGAKVLFQDTRLMKDSLIAPAGWTSMSGNTPEKAFYRESNTTLQGKKVDTSQRTVGTVQSKNSTATVADYFGGWKPVFYTSEKPASPVKAFSMPETNPTIVRSSLSKIETGNRIDGKINIFLAGDSTVKDYSAYGMHNSSIVRDEGAWGEYLHSFFDASKVVVINFANGGRSARNFINEGSLERIQGQIKKGDYLFIQFAHNDSANQSGYLEDRHVPLGKPDGKGIYPFTPGKKVATPLSLVSKYGNEFYSWNSGGSWKWYLSLYIETALRVGATPVLVTPVARQYFNADGSIRPHHDSTDTSSPSPSTTDNAYVRAMKQLATERNILLLDGFELTKNLYENAWKEGSKSPVLAQQIMFPGDSTHHNKLGGFIIASEIITVLKGMKLDISNAIIMPKRVLGENNDGQVVFAVSANGQFSAYSKNSDGKYLLESKYWTTLVRKKLSGLQK